MEIPVLQSVPVACLYAWISISLQFGLETCYLNCSLCIALFSFFVIVSEKHKFQLFCIFKKAIWKDSVVSKCFVLNSGQLHPSVDCSSHSLLIEVIETNLYVYFPKM